MQRNFKTYRKSILNKSPRIGSTKPPFILMFETVGKIEIIPYEERYEPDFARLNQEWLEGFGLLEDADAKHLNFPRESIIDNGGQIFFAVEGEIVVGTCAAIRHSSNFIEIAKLAVAPSARRRGIGRLLTQTAIEYAQGIGASKVFLVSSTKLKSALRLYESMGFIHTTPPEKLDYASADVYMEMVLPEAESKGF